LSQQAAGETTPVVFPARGQEKMARRLSEFAARAFVRAQIPTSAKLARRLALAFAN